MVYYTRCSHLQLRVQFFFTVYISSPSKKELVAFLKKISSREPRLNVVDVDIPLNILCQNDEKLEQVTLGREFHISLGRTVPIRVHQIDSVVSMLRQKLQIQHQSVFVVVLFTCENYSIFVSTCLPYCFLLKQVLDRL